MASSNDNGDGDDSADSDVNLYGRLRNPGPNTTEIEPHDEADEAVDNVGERLRSEQPAADEEAPSIDEQSSPEEVETENDLEDSLLDALDSEEQSERSREDTDSGISNADPSAPEPEDGGTAPGTGTSSKDVEKAAAKAKSDVERSRSSSAEGRGRPQSRNRSRDTDEAGQICGECNSISPSGMRFCVQCGASLRAAGADRDQAEAPDLDRAKLDEEVPAGFALVAINDDGTDGKSIPLESSETIIGREGDTRFPTDEFLDPKHTRLTIEGGELYVEDLNSLNGTYIKLRDEVQLHPGDTFLMGRQVLRFERIEQDLDAKKTADDGTRYMGSPAPGGAYKILQIGVGELVQNIYCLPESGVVLGREKGDIIFPRDKFMSGRHARIFTEDEPYLVDLNSSNGTWIKLWEKRKLDEDDYIFMGQQLFRVDLPG